MLEPWAKWVEDGKGTIYVERDLAITEDYKPCEWFDSNNRDGKKAWLRAKIDVIKVQWPGSYHRRLEDRQVPQATAPTTCSSCSTLR